MQNHTDIIELVKNLSNNYINIINRTEIEKYKVLNWGNNGIGDRFARKIFNYTVINKNGTYKTYSDNEELINEILVADFTRFRRNIKIKIKDFYFDIIMKPCCVRDKII